MRPEKVQKVYLHGKTNFPTTKWVHAVGSVLFFWIVQNEIAKAILWRTQGIPKMRMVLPWRQCHWRRSERNLKQAAVSYETMFLCFSSCLLLLPPPTIPYWDCTMLLSIFQREVWIPAAWLHGPPCKGEPSQRWTNHGPTPWPLRLRAFKRLCTREGALPLRRAFRIWKRLWPNSKGNFYLSFRNTCLHKLHCIITHCQFTPHVVAGFTVG